MKATVFVEKVGKKKYRATTSHPIPLESEGDSQDQALERLYVLAKKRLASGTLMQNCRTTRQQPLAIVRGHLEDHPDFDAFLESIADYRRSATNRKPPHEPVCARYRLRDAASSRLSRNLQKSCRTRSGGIVDHHRHRRRDHKVHEMISLQMQNVEFEGVCHKTAFLAIIEILSP